MQKPDKGLRKRPLQEVPAALEKLKRVILFHPDVIVQEKPAKYCVCGKGERTGRERKGKSLKMVLCEGCHEWFHYDCVGLAEGFDSETEQWTCEWCQDEVDREGYQRWRTDRKQPKRRHFRDTPKANGVGRDAQPPPAFTAPRMWDGKVEEIRKLAQRAAIKKRKLRVKVADLLDHGGHHLVDAEGGDGLELRGVDDAAIEDFVEDGMVDPDALEDD